ncbi:GEVED domain-containing protein [Hydrocarboniphaga sp.]|uniref:GEVED domain-containing protein n=1 Tax=Hydrocarboniphaga sp. TaxID=2033016 RepID=UPI003D11F551
MLSSLLLLTMAAADAEPMPGTLQVNDYVELPLGPPDGECVPAGVAWDGDTAIVAAPSQKVGEIDGAGTLHFFALDADSQQWVAGPALSAAVPLAKACFGTSLEVEGDRLLVGAGQYGSGTAYLFDRQTAPYQWAQSALLTSPDASLANGFGFSVALSGDIAVVGAPLEDSAVQEGAGAVYLFKRDTASGAWSLLQKLVSPTPSRRAQFGYSIMMRDDLLMIGEPGTAGYPEKKTGVWVYRRQGSGQYKKIAHVVTPNATVPSLFGSALAFDGRQLFIGAPQALTPWSTNYPGGAVYVYDASADASAWTLNEELYVGNADGAGYRFGDALTVDDGVLLVSADKRDSSSPYAGPVVYVFQYDAAAAGWRRSTQLSQGQRSSEYYGLGRSTAMRNRRVLVGISHAGGYAETPAPGYMFGLVEDGIDFGDAPKSYPSTLSSDGARHAASALMLGALKDTEADAQLQKSASGDDVNDVDDDDGVVLNGPLITGESVAVTAEVHGSAARLDAWIDWNRDGDWNDSGERVLTALGVHEGLNDFSLPVPADALPGNSYARFRLSSAGTASPAGPAVDGEVEDLLVKIELPTASLEADTSMDESTGRTFFINLNGPLNHSVSVDWSTADGTATAASGDYIASSGTAVLEAGWLWYAIQITVPYDKKKSESTETFKLKISNPVGVTLGDSTQVISVINLDY